MDPSDACRSKRRFALKVAAEVKALSLMNHPNSKQRSTNRLYVYQCPACLGWHLTSRAPREALDDTGLTIRQP